VKSALLPWQLVRVSGPSMVPTLRDGDAVVVRHGARIRTNDVVLATFRSLPGRLVLKRAVREADGGWWLASDNALAGGDSASHGVADVHGRVTWIVTGRRLRRPSYPAGT
jgi:phage repressor protein C with HTH and peptisase S24 domain